MAEKGKFSDSEVAAYLQQWELDGFKFVGNGFLDSDDPPRCPSCDSGGFFYALWEHPLLGRELGIDDEYGQAVFVPLTNVLNRCYRCGHEWVDEDPVPSRSSE